jgi:predicted transcriptional regulator
LSVSKWGCDDGRVADRSSRRQTGALEGEVLAHLWASPGPLTAAEVRANLGDRLAYTTVLTILTRLHAKGLVDREPRGRAFAFRPAVSEAELTARRMRVALDRAGDREAVLMHFVDELSAEDEAALAQLVKALRGRS